MSLKIKVEYDGEYPNLCNGKLVVIINDKCYSFPEYCLCSGGSVTFDEEYCEEVTQGEWSISKWPKDLPKKLRKDVLKAINSSIPYGCCGGCV